MLDKERKKCSQNFSSLPVKVIMLLGYEMKKRILSIVPLGIQHSVFHSFTQTFP
jgi:hypothetical protein